MQKYTNQCDEMWKPRKDRAEIRIWKIKSLVINDLIFSNTKSDNCG